MRITILAFAIGFGFAAGVYFWFQNSIDKPLRESKPPIEQKIR